MVSWLSFRLSDTVYIKLVKKVNNTKISYDFTLISVIFSEFDTEINAVLYNLISGRVSA